MEIYKEYSSFLKNKYGEKVYKLPICLKEANCPNRDGSLSLGGCIYCGKSGVSFENDNKDLSVTEQLLKHKDLIQKKYKAKKFIAYFQSYSNTYLPFELFKKYIKQALIEDIVEIAISTRPDCINQKYLDFLAKIKKDFNINITIELGLQTANYKTLKKINRGHSLAEYIESAVLIKQYDFNICTHIILNLPYDTIEDTIETAKIISALKTDFVKLHALYIEKDTAIAKQFLNNEIKILPLSDYIERVITFLEYLSPNIYIQRLIGRAPEDITIFANWGRSWWVIKEEIEKIMLLQNRYQGKLFNYLNGACLKKFDL